MKRASRSIHRFYKACSEMKTTKTVGEDASNSNTLVFYVNGRKIEDNDVDPHWTLAYYIRNKLYFLGTRLGCIEGGCGCCTVMASRYDIISQKVIHYPISSCLASVCSVHGMAVTTVEGVGSTKTKLHPVQERIIKSHGMQCGYCSPGFVMSMYSLLRQNPKPKFKHITEAFQGNLCRCTGYRATMEGFRTFSEEWLDKKDEPCLGPEDSRHEERLIRPEEFTPYNAHQEPDFPAELRSTNKYNTEYLKIKGPTSTWLRPTTLEQLIGIKEQHPTAKIIAGNTIAKFEIRSGLKEYPFMVFVKNVPEMNSLSVTENGLRIGAAASLAKIREFLKEQLLEYPAEKTRLFKEIHDLIHWMASKQVRSVATMGGNIIPCNTTSDLLTILLVSRVQLEVYNGKEKRFVTLDTNFIGVRKTSLQVNEILVAIHLPFSNKNQYFKVYKQSRRREVDVSVVNFALKVEFEEGTHIISSIFLGIGDVSDKVIEAPITQKKLKGLPWSKAALEQINSDLLQDIDLDLEAPGGNVRYRQCLTLSLFLKSYLAIAEELLAYLGKDLKLFECEELSGKLKFDKENYRSSQRFPVAPADQAFHDIVQRPVVRASGYVDACGEAVYLNDLPKKNKELFLAYIWSTRAHAKIVNLDPSEALKIKGVHAFLSEDDISEDVNRTGEVFKGDEQIFYSKKVTSQGQIIAGILADSDEIARKAVRFVKVEYEDIQPLILSIEDAIKHKSFFPETEMKICFGDVDNILKEGPHMIKSFCRTSNQKHIYMETQRCFIIPEQDGGLEIFSSTQSPTHLARKASEIANISENKIKVRVKRLGSGIGGKQWKSLVVAQPAIVAAKKFQRPIRCILSRAEDMLMIGGRTPYLYLYTVGFDDEGRILACDFDIYGNSGYSLGTNHLILKNNLHHLDNAFNIPALRARGKLCKTNIPSNPLTKGYGCTEAQFAITHALEEIAEYLHKDFCEICEINLYKDGDSTFYGQKLENCNLDKCWNECLKNSKYWERKLEIDIFNSENRYKKRGISIVPTKMGFDCGNLLPATLHAAALVNVYTDGSVLLNIGGVEMGQGLYPKIIQVATRALGIPRNKIHIEETATNVIPNCPATTSSNDINLYGRALLDACAVISEKLRPYREANPNGTWEEWVLEAYVDNVNLSATGLYRSNPEAEDNNLFEYFVCGAACSMVEIDTLTGDHQILTTDIVVDLGNSLNPAIDIGQIEGSFMQGYGLFIMEETLYSPTGTLYTKGPVSYKIPGFGDIPESFNVSLLKGTACPGVIFPSKSADEASQILASSVFYAIKDAIKSARRENCESTSFTLGIPATPSQIRLNCVDPILRTVPETYSSHKPWSVIP